GNGLDQPRTDANGDYRSLPLPLADARGGLRIEASADEFVEEERGVVPRSPAEHDVTADFRLERARVVHGRVVRADHAPLSVAGLGVELHVCGCNADPTTLARPRDAAKLHVRLEEDGSWGLQLDRQDLGWVALFVGTRLIDSAPIAVGEPGPDLELDVAA